MNNAPKMGRPSVLDRETVRKLEDALKCGSSVIEACSYANISRSTFYEHANKNVDFSNKMDVAKQHMFLKARQVIRNAIENNDIKTSMWYLEKYDNHLVDEPMPDHDQKNRSIFEDEPEEYQKRMVVEAVKVLKKKYNISV